jgi:hypothetical protein
VICRLQGAAVSRLTGNGKCSAQGFKDAQVPIPFVSNSSSRYHSEINRQEIIYDENFRQTARVKINPTKKGRSQGS